MLLTYKEEDMTDLVPPHSLNPKTMEIFESWGIHNQITQLWEPATHETIWYRGLDGELVRTDRYLNQPPMGVRCVLTCTREIG